MSKQHDRWLDWKMKHGLATRGRTSGPMNPKGLIAGVLYKVYFKKYDSGLPQGQVFQQSVGGTLGPTGRMNGE